MISTDISSSSKSPKVEPWPVVYFRKVDDQELGKQPFLLLDNRVVVADVLDHYNAFKIDVRDPTSGHFVHLLSNAAGRSEFQFEAFHVHEIRAAKEEPVAVPTDEGGMILVLTRQGYLNVTSIEEYLAAENKVLRSINNVAPSVDSDSWSAIRYDLEDVQLQVRPKPVDAAAARSARSQNKSRRVALWAVIVTAHWSVVAVLPAV